MDAKSLKKMIALQALMKARQEMAIGSLTGTLTRIVSENEDLLLMLDRRYQGQAHFVDPAAILARISTNTRRKGELEQELTGLRQELLQTSRRTQMLRERMADCRREDEKKALALLIEEFAAKQTHSSLP
ncbi:hypothetical protein GCM10011491_27690 [Brucella endophytica]|uniref:Uncharacterized protein n=1 Tax=Brucella endophytica TaxID=1963359 RepID=A0A916SFN8_9HYPH|nr:hypothetical protein [Brucella endophytica]GGA97905.1 hypothetical protein GCM10011491_27690 [Brucella endophytica]